MLGGDARARSSSASSRRCYLTNAPDAAAVGPDARRCGASARATSAARAQARRAATRSPQVAREFNTMADHLAEYRSSSLGELLQAQQSSQAAIDSLPDPVLVLTARRRAAQRQPRRRAICSASATRRPADAVLARAPPTCATTVQRAAASTSRAGKGAYVPKGLEEALADRHARRAALLPAARANPVLGESGERRRADHLLQDVTRLRRFDELKNDLVATVAHEFRTPLTSLRMAIHLCVEGDRRAAHAQAGRPAVRRARGLRAAAGHRRRPARSVAHPGRPDRAPRARRRSRASLLERDDRSQRGAGARQGRRAGAGRADDRPRGAGRSRSASSWCSTNLVTNAIRHTPAGGHVAAARGAGRGRPVRFEVERHRRRHRRRVPAAPLRPLLPRPRRAAGRRRRPRPLHLQGDRRGARRPDRRRERSRPRQHLLVHPARRPGSDCLNQESSRVILRRARAGCRCAAG